MTAPPVAQPSETSWADTATDIVEILPSKQPEGHGFSFKVQSNGRHYRLDSARDPHQPRFWCFRICQCTPAGTVDVTERPWYGGDRMTRNDLPSALAAIRVSLDDWLALPQHADLRDWLLEDRPTVPQHPLISLPTTRRLPVR